MCITFFSGKAILLRILGIFWSKKTSWIKKNSKFLFYLFKYHIGWNQNLKNNFQMKESVFINYMILWLTLERDGVNEIKAALHFQCAPQQSIWNTDPKVYQCFQFTGLRQLFKTKHWNLKPLLHLIWASILNWGDANRFVMNI